MIKQITHKEMMTILLDYIKDNQNIIKNFEIKPKRDFFNQIIETKLEIIFEEK